MFKLSDNFLWFGVLLSILLRWTTSRFPYSGAGKRPIYGDYEAQRHWMEITINLKPTDWYKNTTDNDLLYWGLDYPPLTAYHSYANGLVASHLNPKWVALNKSRGFESYDHKLFMRSTVMVSDLLVFFPAVFLYWWANADVTARREKSLHIICNLIYPGLILIDHGHFQYNCVSLGLTVWAVYFLSKSNHFLASAAFSLALNYKQMSLYHAFPFFFYLLGIIFRQKSYLGKLLKLQSIGSGVLMVFGLCWLPFIVHPDSAVDVLTRLFPFNRGLFEDKVANFWCALEVLVKIRKTVDTDDLVNLSALATLASTLPSGVHLLRNPTFNNFKLSLIVTSLGFFLFSYQVHEKTILIPVMSALLILNQDPLHVFWFSFVSTFSMQPLLEKDGLIVPYVALNGLMLVVFFSVYGDLGLTTVHNDFKRKAKVVLFLGSLFGYLALFISSQFISPPKRLPDLWAVAFAVLSCLHFLGFFVYFYWLQFTSVRHRAINGFSSSSLRDKKVN